MKDSGKEEDDWPIAGKYWKDRAQIHPAAMRTIAVNHHAEQFRFIQGLARCLLRRYSSRDGRAITQRKLLTAF